MEPSNVRLLRLACGRSPQRKDFTNLGDPSDHSVGGSTTILAASGILGWGIAEAGVRCALRLRGVQNSRNGCSSGKAYTRLYYDTDTGINPPSSFNVEANRGICVTLNEHQQAPTCYQSCHAWTIVKCRKRRFTAANRLSCNQYERRLRTNLWRETSLDSVPRGHVAQEANTITHPTLRLHPGRVIPLPSLFR